MHSARTEIVGMDAAAGRSLIKHHQLFALFEAPQRRGERADVHGLRGHIEQMRQNTADLVVKNPDKLTAPWHLDPEQPFDRQAKCMLLTHRRDVIEPGEIRYRRQISLVLDQVFRASMKQYEVRIDALDHLTM